VVAAVVLVAGGGAPLAVRLGASMTLLQLGIGTVNDVVDAPHDAGRKPGKPIPAGAITPAAARVLAIAWIAGGLGLALTVSPTLAVLAVVVVGIGLAYDLWLKGTAWSWLPFAVGIPILPVYGWVGATGTLHPMFTALLPAAVLAGAALAIANSAVDVERDLAAGRTSIAARLGRPRAARVATALLMAVAIVDVAFVDAAARHSGLGIVSVVAVFAAALVAAETADRPAIAEWGWRVQAVSLAVAGVAFVAAALG
jgi:4-hydroxybenzoate polyprenyltransferase